MFDTRCYNCVQPKDGPNKFAEAAYQGNGILKCTRCGNILDVSDRTFVFEIERILDNNKLFTTFIKIYEMLNDIYDVEADIEGLFNNLELGKYTCDVYIFYYCVCDDWDCDTTLFRSTLEQPRAI